MKLLRTLLIINILISGFVTCLHAQRNEYTIYFPTNNATLSNEAKQILKSTVESLKSNGNTFTVKITGHTDNEGSNSSNEILSKNRALNTYLFRVELGVNAESITSEYLGETSPAASNDTEEGRQQNRRVQLIVDIQKPVLVQQPVPVVNGNIMQLCGGISDGPQNFCINLERDTFLIGTKGTIVQYKANTIKKANTSCRCFTLQMHEYYDNSELILSNLTTTSDGRLLESGGMVKLDGYCDGKKYELKDGEFFTVMVPADTILPGMKLLSARRENDSDYLNWQLDAYNSELDDFDTKRMLLTCGFGGGNFEAVKCHFFFCRIGDFVRGIFGERKYKAKNIQNNNAIAKEQAILDKYELKGEALETALQKSKDAAGKDVLKYYVYKNYNWDYRNIDRYKPGTNFINFTVSNKPSPEIDVKIIYKNSRTVVPALEKTNAYVFKDISENTAVWVVGIRYSAERQAYLSIREVNTNEKKILLDFKPVSIDELKAALQKLNR